MSDPVWVPLLLSLKVAGWATLLAAVSGTAAAYGLSRWRWPGRDLLDAILTLPLVLPPTVIGFYLLVTMGGPYLDSTGKVLDSGEVRALAVKVGDKVVFGPYSGSNTVKVDGEDLLVMSENEILAVIEA